MSCQCVISGRWVGREAGRERVAYNVMRPKVLRKRDEVAGVGSIRGSPYTNTIATASPQPSGLITLLFKDVAASRFVSASSTCLRSACQELSVPFLMECDQSSSIEFFLSASASGSRSTFSRSSIDEEVGKLSGSACMSTSVIVVFQRVFQINIICLI